MAKIGWLQSAIGIQGGAELSCGALVQNAPEWAEVVYCRPDRRPPQDLDCFVIQNSTTYDDLWIEELCLKPVVKHIRDPWYAGSAVLRRWLLESASLLIFSSPVQIEAFGYQFTAPHTVMPVPVDLEAFQTAAEEYDGERAGTVAVGRVDIYKGAPQIVDWALRTGEQTTFIGEVMMPFGGLPPFIRFAGKVPYEQMPGILARAKSLIAIPQWPEAFGRNVVEGWAAGCELVLQGRIGARYWIENEPERLGYEGPIAEFWQAVESAL